MTIRQVHDDIPGTTLFDGRMASKGYALNKMCFSFNDAANRKAFVEDEDAVRGVAAKLLRAAIDEYLATDEGRGRDVRCARLFAAFLFALLCCVCFLCLERQQKFAAVLCLRRDRAHESHGDLVARRRPPGLSQHHV